MQDDTTTSVPLSVDALPGRTGARQRQTRTRKALLTAARRLMAQGVRTAFTVDELTATADVAKGSFYNHLVITYFTNLVPNKV